MRQWTSSVVLSVCVVFVALRSDDGSKKGSAVAAFLPSSSPSHFWGGNNKHDAYYSSTFHHHHRHRLYVKKRVNRASIDADVVESSVAAATSSPDDESNNKLHDHSKLEEASSSSSSSSSVDVDGQQQQQALSADKSAVAVVEDDVGAATEEEEEEEVVSEDLSIDEQLKQQDEKYMRMALELAQSSGSITFPGPAVGCVLVSSSQQQEDGDCRILGQGRADYQTDAIRNCLEDAGLDVTPLTEWCVAWPSPQLRHDLVNSTLYTTLEPSPERRGTALPPLTQLLPQVAGLRRVVIGCADPVPERATKGAAALHAAGLEVKLLDDESVLNQECQEVIQNYAELANSKLHAMARKHFDLFGRPLGFLHCSVIDSDNVDAFARHGNAFGVDFGGKQNLSFRNFGAYEIAPPPEVVWASSTEEEEEEFEDYDAVMTDQILSVDFEEEDYQGDIVGNPMMPWYEQVDAVVATFPRAGGNGPAANDNSLAARLNGLKWLATYGNELPAAVERILVMDATDLKDLPLTNDNGILPNYVDVEAFWQGRHRKPARVLLRRGTNAQARAAAQMAAQAAQAAAQAAQAAAAAIESGQAAQAAEAALEAQRAAQAAANVVQKELEAAQSLKRQLEAKGVIVETIEGGEPIDVMKHLGERNGLRSVVWRAGCWGERGVKAILAGAFQWVSAHLAVDAVGGKFWQLMIAENAVQAACGPDSLVKVFADQEDISLEYCDQADADTDCNLSIDGRPVRHVRLDCRVALVDSNRPREFVTKTKKLNRKMLLEQAPWFL